MLPSAEPILLATAAVFAVGAVAIAVGQRFGARRDPRVWRRYALEVVLVSWILGAAAVGGVVWSAVVAVTCAAAAWELSSVVPRRGAARALGPTAAVACALAAFSAPRWPRLASALLEGSALVALGLEARAARRAVAGPTPARAFGLVGLVPVAAAAALARIGGGGGAVTTMVFLYGVLEGADSAAYVIGGAFGRTPLAPALSPNKTREGAAAALVAAAALGAGLASFVPGLDAWRGAAVGVGLGVAGALGDLATSALKRRAGVKDFAAWIPHHGGVMDAYDTLLVVAPVWDLFAS